MQLNGRGGTYRRARSANQFRSRRVIGLVGAHFLKEKSLGPKRFWGKVSYGKFLCPGFSTPVCPCLKFYWMLFFERPEKWCILGAQCFQNGHFGRISSTLSFTVLQSLGGHASARCLSHKPCFRQAHCFVHPKSHMCPIPHLGFSDFFTYS